MSTNTQKTVFVGLSGGVDSSVAALLLKKAGYNVIGAFIKSYNVDGCEEKDAEYARRAAEKLDIPFYTFDMREEYFSRVVAEMIDGYRAGITPNPDILCNREIKFGLFWERAEALGADFIATGHYVRLEDRKLFEAKDKNKDQSYFLWKLTQDDLEHCLFPIGEYTKPEVRKMAREADLPTAERKDSQGICFLGKVKLSDFLKKYIASKKGDILDIKGRKIGEHDGAWFYTIGQRHLGTCNMYHVANSNQKPFYVVSKDVEKNVLVVAEGEDNPELFKKEIQLTNINFIPPIQHSNILQNVGMSVMARVRYRQSLAEAKLHKLETGNYKLEFREPVKFVAPGQSAVFYSIDERVPPASRQILGGGVIF